MNWLTREEKDQVWIPRIVFNNTDDEDESILDAKTTLMVIRKVSRRSETAHSALGLLLSLLIAH